MTRVSLLHYYLARVAIIEPTRHIVWTSGLLTCVLVPRAAKRYAVQILDSDRIVVSEPCNDVDQAIKIADALWSMLVDRPKEPVTR